MTDGNRTVNERIRRLAGRKVGPTAGAERSKTSEAMNRKIRRAARRGEISHDDDTESGD